VLIGSHVSPEDPLAAAEAEGAEAVQIFLGNPQSWKAPKPRSDAARLRESPVPVYVHAPYLINVASPNNRVRIPSRKILQQTCDAAVGIGATAVIVHGGHVTADDDLQAGFERWRKALDQLETTVPVYLENTAGGDHAIARQFDTIARLWDYIGDHGIGFCLDTCHAWAAGEALIDAVDRITSITGRIDLVHCNDSKDPHGSGRDRHANLGTGEIDVDVLVAVVRAADAPVICETADQGRKDDIALLRDRTARQ
jgi:deoxyribonuclease IV